MLDINSLPQPADSVTRRDNASTQPSEFRRPYSATNRPSLWIVGCSVLLLTPVEEYVLE